MTSEQLAGFLLVALLVVLGAFFGFRELRALNRLRTFEHVPEEEGRYIRRKAFRRIAASVLMWVAACLLAGSFWISPGVEERAEKLRVEKEENNQTAPSPEDRQVFHLYTLYWIGFLLVVLALLILAWFDLMATRQFGISQHRKIQDDRRAMIEEELLKLKYDRNGHIN